MAAPAVRVRDEASGREIVVSPEQARDGFLKGAYKPTEDRVRVGRGKNTATVDASEVREAIDSGWNVISESQASDAKMAREESTGLAQVRGTAEAFTSGLSFGLSDLIATNGDDEAAKRFAVRGKQLGSVGDGARLAGEVLPVVFSGGAAAGAKVGATGVRAGVLAGAKQAVRRAGSLPRAVEGLGVLAESGTKRLLGEGLGGRTAGAFARGAVEGAAGGIGEEIHESVLGGREITAERVLAAGGMGALFGGGAGAAFPLTGAAFRKGGTMASDSVASVMGKAQGMKPDGSIIGGLAQTIASGKKAGPAGQQIQQMVRDNPTLYRALHEQDAVIEEIGTSVRKASEAYGDAQRRGVAAFEADRAGNFGKLLRDTGDGQVARYAADDLGSVLARLDEHMSVAEVPDFRRNFDQMALQKSRAALALAEDAAGGAKAGKAYQEQVLALRKVQDELARLRKLDKSPDTVDMLVDVEGMLKSNLGHAKYGRAAQGFREVTASDAAYFAEAEKMGNTSVGRLLDRAKQSTNADAVDVAKQYGKFRSADRISAAEKAMERDLYAMRKRAEYSDSPAMRAAADDMDAAIKQMRGAMGEASDNATILGRQTEMGRSPLSGVLSAMGPSGAAIVGGMLGGPVGVAIGGGLAMMARPGSSIRTMSAIKHAAKSSGVRIDRITKAITSTASKAKTVVSRGAKRASRRRKPGATRTVATRAASRAAPRGESQRKRQRRAQELADPATLERELAAEMFALTKVAPGISGAMAERVALGAQFLASKLPPGESDPFTGERPRVDEATLARFDRYYEAVTDPLAALERLEAGTFTTEHAEALREVWPSLYADLQEKTLLGMQEAAERGERIPYARRMSLGILLGIPTDATLKPSFLAVMAQVHGGERAKEAGEQQQGPAPKAEGRTRKATMKSHTNYATTLGRLEQSES